MSTSGATNPNFPDGKISVAKPDLFYGDVMTQGMGATYL